MSKIKITDIAARFDVTKEQVLSILREAGCEARTSVAPIDASWLEKVEPLLEKAREAQGKPRRKSAPTKAASVKPAARATTSVETPVVVDRPIPEPTASAKGPAIEEPVPAPDRVIPTEQVEKSTPVVDLPVVRPEAMLPEAPPTESGRPPSAPVTTSPLPAVIPPAAGTVDAPGSPLLVAPKRRQPSFNPDRPRPAAPPPSTPTPPTYLPTPRGITGGPRPGYGPGGEKVGEERPAASRDSAGTTGKGTGRPPREGGAREGAAGYRGTGADRGPRPAGPRGPGDRGGGPGGPRREAAPAPAAGAASTGSAGPGWRGGSQGGGGDRGGPGGGRRSNSGAASGATAVGSRGPGGPGGPGRAPAGPGGAAGGAPTPGPATPGGTGSKPGAKGSPGRKRKTKEQIESEIFFAAQQNVNRVMVDLDRGKIQRRYERGRGGTRDEEQVEKRVLKVAEFITISEMANLLDVPPAKVIAKAMGLGVMVTINARLDHETIAIIADEFGFQAELMDEYAEDLELGAESGNEDPDQNIRRAPIVTVMGHVDHGKTSLLDHLRKTQVAAGESGGITQHIGAYEVRTSGGTITFLDTPGHEAFSAMRARGAKVTDIVVLVVAADSQVMPQTKEAIDHARAAQVPIVVAITKIDLPDAKPDNIRAQLGAYGIEVEQWGGKTQCIEISARRGINIDKLLDAILLEAEMLDLAANPTRRATGTVLEARLDRGKGVVASILVQDGTLRVGDAVLVGSYAGKVRMLADERGERRDVAGPSVPVQLLGLDGVPQAGDSLLQFEDEREAREIAARRLRAQKERELRRAQRRSLEDLSNRIASGEQEQTLRVIIKGDVDGSVEAIATSLEQLTTREVRVEIISRAVGGIKEADVMLAAASDAIIVGFHVRPDPSSRELASREGVEIRSYRVIYEVVDDIRAAMEGMLKPEIREEVAGEAEVRAVFRVPKMGAVAGCMITSGKVERNTKARLYRDGVEVCESRVVTLKRFKDDVTEVRQGFECGIGLHNHDDFQEGDVIAFFREIEVARKLTPVAAGLP